MTMHMRDIINTVLRLDESVVPPTLYHATLKSAIPDIEQQGLQPAQGSLWNDGPPLVFAADDKGRRKLLAVMLFKVSKLLHKPFEAVTGEDVLQNGAVAVIAATELFQRAQGRDKPIQYLEPGDYFAKQPVPVERFLTDEAMVRFLRSQLRIWAKVNTQS